MKIFKEIIVKRKNMFILDSQDYQVLSMLYKPIIGFEALNIYSTLYMLSLNNEKINSMLLFKDMTADDMINDSKLKDAFIKLSNIKLLSIDDENVLIYPPYDAGSFLNSKLGEYLTVYVSKPHLNLLMERFIGKIIEIKTPIDNDINNLSHEIKPCERSRDTLPFSFNEFKIQASSFTKVLDSDEQFFSSLASIYSFSLSEMLSLFFDSADDDSYDKNKIITKAYDKYIKTKEKEKRLEGKTKADEDYINYFLNTKPEMIFENGSRMVSKADRNTVTRMRDELNLSDPMISLLVCYSLATNEHKMHSFSFFSKIDSDWKEKNILTVEDAFLYINSLYSKTYKNKNSQNQKSSEEWFEEFWKKAKEEINKW